VIVVECTPSASPGCIICPISTAFWLGWRLVEKGSFDVEWTGHLAIVPRAMIG
jgi:hypothetical protein